MTTTTTERTCYTVTVPGPESPIARLGRLDRQVRDLQVMRDRQRRRNDHAPEGELDEEDVYAEHTLTLLHAHAWQAYQQARRDLGMED